MLFGYTYSFFLQEVSAPHSSQSSIPNFYKFLLLYFNLKNLFKMFNNGKFRLYNHFLFFNESTRVNVVIINTTMEIHDA